MQKYKTEVCRRYEQLSKELQGVVAKYVGEHKDSPVSAILLDDYVSVSYTHLDVYKRQYTY